MDEVGQRLSGKAHAAALKVQENPFNNPTDNETIWTELNLSVCDLIVDV